MAVLHSACPVPQSLNLLVAKLVTFAHCLPLLRRLVTSGGDLRHDCPGLLGKIHGGADEDHGFNAARLQGCHVTKSVAAHAQPNCPTFADFKMIEQSEGVKGALAMGNRPGRVGGPAVAACVRLDERVFTCELIAAGMDPIFLAACAAMQKQKRLSRAFRLVIHLDTVEVNAFRLHGAHYRGGRAKKQSSKCA